MSRTVHHVPYKQRTGTKRDEQEERVYRFAWWRNTWPDTANEIPSALRYSAADLAEAEAGGRRPRPSRVTRRLRAGTYPRASNLRVIGALANRQERALRAADRTVDRWARQVLRGAEAPVEAAWDVDFPDPRHRHDGLWDSW